MVGLCYKRVRMFFFLFLFFLSKIFCNLFLLGNGKFGVYFLPLSFWPEIFFLSFKVDVYYSYAFFYTYIAYVYPYTKYIL